MKVFLIVALVSVLVSGCGSSGPVYQFDRNPVSNLFAVIKGNRIANPAVTKNERVDKRSTTTNLAANRGRHSASTAEIPARSSRAKKRALLSARRKSTIKSATAARPIDCEKDARRITEKLQRQNDRLKGEGMGLCKSAKIYKAAMTEVASMWKSCRKLDPTGDSLRTAREAVKHANAMIQASCARPKAN